MPFQALGLSPHILRALADEGYSTPTPIQAKAIPPIIEGRDVLGSAQTGTGKTAAFALPVIHRLADLAAGHTVNRSLPRVLVLGPTRELAQQIADSFRTYGRHTGLRGAVVYGGVSQHHQVKAIRGGIDILVATPGRLIDLMDQGVISLNNIEIFVLDEADRMLEMGFIQPIRQIAAALPSKRQTLMFSATMPKEITHLAESLLRNPERVTVASSVATTPKIEERLYKVSFKRKQTLLEHVLQDAGMTRVVVFTKTKHGADKVCKGLLKAGIESVAIHGNKSQNFRQRALGTFRSGHARVMVATDVAARGLDVDNVTHVINFDLPMEPEAYVHRIGRTGRAGATGSAMTFCAPQERALLRDVERMLGRPIPKADLPIEDDGHEEPGHAPRPGGKPQKSHHERPKFERPRRQPADESSRPIQERPPRQQPASPVRSAKGPNGHSMPRDARTAPRTDERRADGPRTDGPRPGSFKTGGFKSGGFGRPSSGKPAAGGGFNSRPAKAGGAKGGGGAESRAKGPKPGGSKKPGQGIKRNFKKGG
jgi:ATP-dependent RNA helicase RhlE